MTADEAIRRMRVMAPVAPECKIYGGFRVNLPRFIAFPKELEDWNLACFNDKWWYVHVLGAHFVCFQSESDALMFKLQWTEVYELELLTRQQQDSLELFLRSERD